KALVEAAGRRGIEQDQFRADLAERPLRLLVRRLLVGRLELPPKRRTMPMRQIVHNIFSLQSRALARWTRRPCEPRPLLPLRASVPIERTVVRLQHPSSNRT